MLDIGYHDGGRVQVELLHRSVGSKGEQGGTRAIDGQTLDMLQCWYRVTSDVLSSNIP